MNELHRENGKFARKAIGQPLIPVTFRVSPAERQQLSAQAQAAGLSVSEYIRRRALGLTVVSQSDLTLLNELRRQGGLLKHYILADDHQHALRREAAQTLAEIQEAIRRIALDR